MKEINISSRGIFLEASVAIEDMLSLLLSILLGVKKRKKSKSLGTKSTALSFNAKFNLLLDMDCIGKENTWKFQKFMEMRNQFAHNVDVTTFEKCFEFVEGKEKLLSSYLHDKSLPLEERLRNVSVELAFEVLRLGRQVTTKISDKYRIERLLEGLSSIAIAFLTAIKKLENISWEKKDAKELLAEFLISIFTEVTAINKASPEEKNSMIRDIFTKEEFPDLFKMSSIRDFFTDEELANIIRPTD